MPAQRVGEDIARQRSGDTMTGDAAFKLSRVFAEGWNVASKLTAAESESCDARCMATLNPYAADPEKSRWNEGFVKALGT